MTAKDEGNRQFYRFRWAIGLTICGWVLCNGIVYGVGVYFRPRLSGLEFGRIVSVTFLACGIIAVVLVSFLSNQWFVRLNQFRASLKREALHLYLLRFWPDRANSLGINFSKPDALSERKAEQLIGDIYDEHYGLKYFVRPFVFVFIMVFADAALVAWLFDCTHEHNLPSASECLIFGTNPALSLACLAGAYMFVVSDCVYGALQNTLNVGDVYWYALRLLIAIPLGVAVGNFSGTTADAHTLVAFALGALPVEEIQKLLRRVSNAQLALAEAKQESDQLLSLEGVTVRISALLAAQGVTSIAQMETSDPVLLAARTGLDFDLILNFASQAIVRNHIGASASVLVPLGLHRAQAIRTLLDGIGLDAGAADDATAKRAKSLLETATQRLNSYAKTLDNNSAEAATAAVEDIFRKIAGSPCTEFLHAVSPIQYCHDKGDWRPG